MQSQWDEEGVGEVERGEIRGEEPSMTVSLLPRVTISSRIRFNLAHLTMLDGFIKDLCMKSLVNIKNVE